MPRRNSENDSSDDDSKIDNKNCMDKDVYRLVFLGAAAVGKSAIICQVLGDTFPTEHKPTVEELHCKVVGTRDRKMTVEVLDTSGLYEFPAMRDLAIRTADAFVLVFSLTDYSTFEQVQDLRDAIVMARGESCVPIVVVGNKCDVEESERKVATSEAVFLVDYQWRNAYVETSAKNNSNLDEIFREIVKQGNFPLCVEQISSPQKRNTESKQKKKSRLNNCILS